MKLFYWSDLASATHKLYASIESTKQIIFSMLLHKDRHAGCRYGWQREYGGHGHPANRPVQTAPNLSSGDDSSISIDWAAEEGSESVRFTALFVH